MAKKNHRKVDDKKQQRLGFREARPGEVDFDGDAYNRKKDKNRLTGQLLDIVNVMKDGRWRTVEEIAQKTGHKETSISAQLRNLRKEKFGSNEVDKQRRGGETSAEWEFRLTINLNSKFMEAIR